MLRRGTKKEEEKGMGLQNLPGYHPFKLFIKI
jgi:hypothetical protein